MSVHAIDVDGVQDHLTGTDDIVAWVQACNAVHAALEGRDVQVTARRTPQLRVHVDPPVFTLDRRQVAE